MKPNSLHVSHVCQNKRAIECSKSQTSITQQLLCQMTMCVTNTKKRKTVLLLKRNSVENSKGNNVRQSKVIRDKLSWVVDQIFFLELPSLKTVVNAGKLTA